MKVLIVIDNLNIGGIASSLYNFLNVLNNYEITCDLLVFDEKSINKKRIPSSINICKSTKILSILGISQKEIMKKSIFLGIYRFLLVFISKITSGNLARKILFFGINQEKKYDLAIAYCHDLAWNSFSPGCRQFVQSKVNSTKKAVYIHCDYQNYGGYDLRQENDYEKFDNILCVSSGCKKSFLKCFPKLKDKTYILENFIDVNDILSKSINSIEYSTSNIVFITICRLSKEKGIIRCLQVFKKINDEGIKNFLWVIIGSGKDEKIIKKYIFKFGLSNNIKIIGYKENPYLYMKNADYMLLPSKHEAAPMVFGEAAILGITTITTRTISADELVTSRKIGWVCDNTPTGLYKIIKCAIREYKKYKCVKIGQFKDIINSNAKTQLDLFIKELLKEI